MSKTILITGTSTGIGRATVKYFSEHGWNVAATMRTPAKEKEMQHWKNVKLYEADVMNTASIKNAINNTINDFGAIDVICNNAGYGAVGIFEKATDEEIRKQFDTNVFGCMNVIRAILPYFREKKAGTIINITSMGGLITFPIYSVYHATKWAMEGFSESLAYELKPLGIKVKCIEPGSIKTDFATRSQGLFKNDSIAQYDEYEKVTYANTQKSAETGADPAVVAKTIYKAASANNFKLRYPVGGIGPMLLFMRWILPFKVFSTVVKTAVEKGYKK